MANGSGATKHPINSMEDLNNILSKLLITSERTSKDVIIMKKHLMGANQPKAKIMNGFPLQTVDQLNAFENKLQFNQTFCNNLVRIHFLKIMVK